MSASTLMSSPPATSVSMDVMVVDITVVVFSMPTEHGHVFYAEPSHSVIECTSPMLYRITWTLEKEPLWPASLPDPELDDVPIAFADPQAPQLHVADPGNRTSCTYFWSNINTTTRTAYSYTINAHVGSFAMEHDPTVENIPPGTP